MTMFPLDLSGSFSSITLGVGLTQSHSVTLSYAMPHGALDRTH